MSSSENYDEGEDLFERDPEIASDSQSSDRQSDGGKSAAERSSSDQGSSSEAEDQLSQEVELSEEGKLEADILSQAAELEEVTPYQQNLTFELFEKLKDLRVLARDKSSEDLITVRIQQLVINKLLVLTHQRSEFRLILAHYHLGKAYLANECTDQAIEHISIALHKNEKLFEDLPDTRLLQTYFQNELAASLLKKQNIDDAIELLRASISEEDRLKEQMSGKSERKEVKNTKALVLLSQCYLKVKDYEAALEVIDQVLAITRKKKMAKEEYAFALVDKSKILAEMRNFPEAIAFEEQAIDILMEENYSNPEEVAEMYSLLADYHEELENIESALTCTQKVKTLYQELYSPDDKRVIKSRRKIATYLLKSERFKEAVNELLEVVELEEKVFGENSLQTARTLKLLGAVYISLEVSDARAYLKRAMSIYSNHGNKRQVEEIRAKLRMLLGDQRTQNADKKILSEHEI